MVSPQGSWARASIAHALPWHQLSVNGLVASFAEKTSDESLVGLMAKQDKRAIRVLFSRYNAQVFRFLMPMVGNQATAEDLVSEFLIEVWRRAAGFEVRSREGT